MPRPNRGPRLVPKQPPGYAESYWFIRWYDQGAKKEKSTGIPVSRRDGLKAAETRLEGFLNQRRRRAGKSDPDETFLADILADYLDEHAPTTANPSRIAYAVDRLLPYWGERPVSSIKKSECRRYFRQRSKELAKRHLARAEASARSDWGDGGFVCFHATVRKELGVLNAALGHAKEEGRLPHYTAAAMPPKNAGRERILDRQEAALLLRRACWIDRGIDWRQKGLNRRYEPRRGRHHVPLFVILGLYTGARPNALFKLRWTQNMLGGYVDFNRGIIDFNPVGRDRTESTKRYPVIPIPRRLMTFLRLARQRATSDFVIECESKPIKSVKTGWNAARDAAGFGSEVQPYTLRHTCASWMMKSGKVTKEEGAKWLGDTVKTFEDTYWHHHPDFMKAARDSMA